VQEFNRSIEYLLSSGGNLVDNGIEIADGCVVADDEVDVAGI